MNKLLILFLLTVNNFSFAQGAGNQQCQIEFYLLKSVKPNKDLSKRLSAEFSVTKLDLEDTAFIRDYEIVGYHISNQTLGRQSFEVSELVTDRVKNLDIPLGSGRQFALVVNGEIVYAGYFWNLVSSWGCDGIAAFAMGNKIEILRKLPDINHAVNSNDPRRNATLFDCLKKTNRLYDF
ncbi:MAG: hypothetical protein HYZ44_10180 [Bacteroidetes bacterium]|nr:hypothetical protein [Bacteroidota bacterium]